MGRSIQIRVDESLAQILERIRREVAMDMKTKYNLNDITINGNLTSKILAAKFNGQRTLNFKINKMGLNRGVIELL